MVRVKQRTLPAERFRCEVEIRQWMVEHDRGVCVDSIRDCHELFLAIAKREPWPLRRSTTRRDERRPDARGRASDRRTLDLFETRPPVVNPLMKSRTEHAVCAD